MNPWSKLATGDCLKQLKRLKDDSVDLIVTDPPYGISFMGRDWDKAVPPVEVWRECLRVLKPGAFAFIMSSPRQDCLARMILNLEEAGLPEKAKPQMGEFKDNPGRATPKSSPTPRPNHHPTAKPVRLMSYLVMLGSREGDVVLDPYTGSGTTGVAVVGLQRNFLGCDLDPEYVQIAVSRIKWVKENGLGALSKAPKPKRKHKQQPKKTLWERKSK